MSDSVPKSRPRNPYAPQIPHSVLAERTNFFGEFIAAVLYGIVTLMFFRCMCALFSPDNRTAKNIRRGLMVHTSAMFIFATIATAAGLSFQSISWIDNREFSGNGTLPQEAIGYKSLVNSQVMTLVTNIMFQLNQWLADGLFLYRCYVIYSRNHWTIAFPCLMYLTTFVTGTLYIRRASDQAAIFTFGLPYFSISLALNILLTLMVIVRLVLYNRAIQSFGGAPAVARRLYKNIVTMLIESCALYTFNSVLFLGSWSVDSDFVRIFWPALMEAQAIASFLLIPRVTGGTYSRQSVTYEDTGAIRFGSPEDSTHDDGILVGSIDLDEEAWVPGFK